MERNEDSRKSGKTLQNTTNSSRGLPAEDTVKVSVQRCCFQVWDLTPWHSPSGAQQPPFQGSGTPAVLQGTPLILPGHTDIPLLAIQWERDFIQLDHNTITSTALTEDFSSQFRKLNFLF